MGATPWRMPRARCTSCTTFQSQNVKVGLHPFRTGFRFLVRLELFKSLLLPKTVNDNYRGQWLTPSSAEAVVPPIDVFDSPRAMNLIQDDLACVAMIWIG